MPRQYRGYTLSELLLAASILAALAAIALPRLASALSVVRAQDARALLSASLLGAMSEATLGNQRAVLCPSRDGETCSGGYHWQDGWIGFLDRNRNGRRDAGERQFSQVTALPAEVRLASSPGRTRLAFQPGSSNAGANVTFTLCDGRGAAHAQRLALSNTGRISSGRADPARARALCGP